MKLDLPDIAKGKILPPAIQQKIHQEAKEEELRKKQYKHDWRIAIVSSALGGIFGFLASLAFWLITSA